MKIYFIKTDNNAEKLSSVLFPLIYKRETKENIDIPYQQIKRNQYGKPLPIRGCEQDCHPEIHGSFLKAPF